MSSPMKTTVVGAGAWGTALAMVLAEKGHAVTLWSYESEVVSSINESRKNPYLQDITLPEQLRAEGDLGASVQGAELVVSVSPSQVVRSVMEVAGPRLEPSALLVSASKGIELTSLLRMDELLRGLVPPSVMDRFCVLSGPSFAREVAEQAPTAVVVASGDIEAAEEAQRAFQTPWFRVYTNPDVVGVELGGALKNVIAVAAGVAAGLGYGHNTTAALITRGLAEITRLGVAMGARQATFYGLAGMGDLVLTCTGSLSRNRTVGFRLGQGERLADILSDMTAVAEGVKTASAVHELAGRYGVEMPIAEQVYAIVEEGRSAAEAVQTLMLRDPKPEEWS
jgi:glycerol-3-phosphate dehydrogenase (NAD(P)+)